MRTRHTIELEDLVANYMMKHKELWNYKDYNWIRDRYFIESVRPGRKPKGFTGEFYKGSVVDHWLGLMRNDNEHSGDDVALSILDGNRVELNEVKLQRKPYRVASTKRSGSFLNTCRERALNGTKLTGAEMKKLTENFHVNKFELMTAGQLCSYVLALGRDLIKERLDKETYNELVGKVRFTLDSEAQFHHPIPNSIKRQLGA